MFATRSIVHALIPDPAGLRYGSSHRKPRSNPYPFHKYTTTTCTIPLGQMASKLLILAIYIVNSLNSWQSEQNWPIGQIGGKTLELQRKVVARSVANPVSKLANRSKTGQICYTSTIQISALARSGQKLAKKLANTSVTPVTQITESLSTRRTRWYNGWYNNQLKES